MNLVFRNTRSISKLSKLSLSIFGKRDLNSVQMKSIKRRCDSRLKHALTTFRCIGIYMSRRHYSYTFCILCKHKRHLSTKSENFFYKHVQHDRVHVLTIFNYIPGKQHGFYLISPQRSPQISTIGQPFYGSDFSLLAILALTNLIYFEKNLSLTTLTRYMIVSYS